MKKFLPYYLALLAVFFAMPTIAGAQATATPVDTGTPTPTPLRTMGKPIPDSPRSVEVYTNLVAGVFTPAPSAEVDVAPFAGGVVFIQADVKSGTCSNYSINLEGTTNGKRWAVIATYTQADAAAGATLLKNHVNAYKWIRANLTAFGTCTLDRVNIGAAK